MISKHVYNEVFASDRAARGGPQERVQAVDAEAVRGGEVHQPPARHLVRRHTSIKVEQSHATPTCHAL